MYRRIFIAALAIIFTGCLYAQRDYPDFRVELNSGYTGPGNLPFWMRSNQFGNIAPGGASLGLTGSVKKDYNADEGIFDWGFSLEGRANLGRESDLIFTEGYGKVRVAMFELLGGRVKDIIGICDTSLTSGSYSQSGNALGIPKIQLSIPEFYTLPFLGRLFAFRGNYVHGWMGMSEKNFDTLVISETYLHQKSLYGRFGKPEWRLKLYGGFNHQVVWGDEDIFMGEDYNLSTGQSYFYVITGRRLNNNTIQGTRIGNHLGTIDLGLEYNFTNLRLMLYRQNIYEAGALYYFANILDGLNGVSITNKKAVGNKTHWEKFLIEFLYTKNQAGEVWSRYTPSPIENYYNNGYYLEGWSYKGVGLGNPFITTANSIKEEFPSIQFFSNNRVIMLHLGFEGVISDFNVSTKLSYSKNYGTYRTAAEGKETQGYIFPSPFGVFPVAEQFSGYLKVSGTIHSGITLGVVGALDAGELYDNTFGIMCFLSKAF